MSTSLLVTAQHSEAYRKIGRMHVLYNFSLVEMAILDFQIWLSRFCKALIDMVLAARQIPRYKRLTLAAVIFQTAEYHVMNTFIRTKAVTK